MDNLTMLRITKILRTAKEMAKRILCWRASQESMTMNRARHFFEGRTTQDGKMAAFQIETTDGNVQSYEMDINELANTIQYLSYVSDDAAKKRTDEKPVSFDRDKPIRASPRSFTHFGFSGSETSGKAVLVFRNYDVDIGFEMDAQQLSDLATGADYTAENLRTGHIE